MVINQDELSKIFELMQKNMKESSISDCCKKIQSREINIVLERNEVDFMKPNLLSSFFIKNIELVIDRQDIIDNNPSFELDMLVCIRDISKTSYELVDFNNQKLRLPKTKVRAKMKEAPLEVFLNIIN